MSKSVSLIRHPEVPERSEGLEGRRPESQRPFILRGPLRGHLRMTVVLVALFGFTFATPALAQKKDTPRNYGIGHVATPAEIAGWDIDVRADGQGAPPGKGSVKEGEKVYLERCAACHGEFGESAGRWPQLAQGKGTLASHDPVKTVGSYFAHLSTVLDYIRRAMPFGDAQSLGNDELYAVTAYVLNLNDIVDDKFVLSKETWRQVKMPNEGGFYDDDREKTEKAFWTANPCMSNCRPPAKITGRAQAVDVTPDDKGKKQGVE